MKHDGMSSVSTSSRTLNPRNTRDMISTTISSKTNDTANIDKSEEDKLFQFDDNRLKALFIKYDYRGDGTGSLGVEDIIPLFAEVGILLSRSEVKSTMKIIDLDRNGTLELEEFLIAIARARNRASLKTCVADLIHETTVRGTGPTLQRIFLEFKEINDSGEEGVSKDGLCDIIKLLDIQLPRREQDLIFRRITKCHDTNHTNRGSLAEADNRKTLITPNQLSYIFRAVNSRKLLNDRLLDLKASDANGLEWAKNKQFLSDTFWQFESSGNGHMVVEDLLAVVEFLGLDFSQKKSVSLLKEMDTDGNGHIDLGEFIMFFSHIRNLKKLDTMKGDELRKNLFKRRLAIGVFVLSFTASLVLGIIGITTDDNKKTTMIALTGIFGVLAFSSLLVLFGNKISAILPLLWNSLTPQFIWILFLLSCPALIVTGIGYFINPNNLDYVYRDVGIVDMIENPSVWYYCFYTTLAIFILSIVLGIITYLRKPLTEKEMTILEKDSETGLQITSAV